MTASDALRTYLTPTREPKDLEQKTDARFLPETVTSYVDNPETFKENHGHPRHHYSQATRGWGDTDTATTLLNRLDIPPRETTITIVGGFTGEFAETLRDAGCEVLFTDPMPEWIAAAQDAGFEAVQCAAETLPLEILTRSDGIATFECYYPLSPPSSSIYETLRFLSTKHGLLFAESEATRQDLRDSGADVTLLTELGAYCDAFGTTRRYRETDNLRIYQYTQLDEPRDPIFKAAAILRALYEYSEKKKATTIDVDARAWVADELGLQFHIVDESLGHLHHLYRELIPASMRQYIPYDDFEISGRQFNLEF